MRLLGLEFRSDNTLKLEARKHIVKRYYLIMNTVVWFCKGNTIINMFVTIY